MDSALDQLLGELRYDASAQELGPALATCFVPLAPDEELLAWLRNYGARPHGRFETTLISWLDRFASSYDVHGWLRAYAMHLLSARAWGELLAKEHKASLLDVGAGAGYVTEGARAYFDEIVCTETSPALRRRLRQCGFAVLETDLSREPLARKFDVVSCFNVLDRTAAPLSLLRALIAHLQPSGRLLISIPLPARPHVHVPGGTIAPRERLPSTARTWEAAAREISELLLAPAGLSVERLSRVPYLSRGDATHLCYVLDAALWVCRRKEDATCSS